MIDFLITYDLKQGNPSPHKAFLVAAEKEGLLYVWKGMTFVNRLPNSTVWGIFESKESVSEAFDRALVAAGSSVGYKVQLTKRAVTEFRNAWVTSDIRKVPNPTLVGRTAFETSRLHQLKDTLFSLG